MSHARYFTLTQLSILHTHSFINTYSIHFHSFIHIYSVLHSYSFICLFIIISSWFHYSTMLRIYKHYNINIKDSSTSKCSPLKYQENAFDLWSRKNDSPWFLILSVFRLYKNVFFKLPWSIIIIGWFLHNGQVLTYSLTMQITA